MIGGSFTKGLTKLDEWISRYGKDTHTQRHRDRHTDTDTETHTHTHTHTHRDTHTHTQRDAHTHTHRHTHTQTWHSTQADIKSLGLDEEELTLRDEGDEHENLPPGQE